MNLLDTNVLSHLQKQDSVGNAIVAAMTSSPDQDFQITAVNAYEILVGAFELIRDLRKRARASPRAFSYSRSCWTTSRSGKAASFRMTTQPTRCTAGSRPAFNKS